MLLHHEVMPAHPIFIGDIFLGTILEESVFRELILPVLAGAPGNTAAVLISSILFAASHKRATSLTGSG